MSIKDMPHVTVEQVLALRDAAIELEKNLHLTQIEHSMYVLENHVAKEKLEQIKHERTAYKTSLENLEASIPNIKADAVLDLCKNETSIVRLRNDNKRSVIFVSDAYKYANKLEAEE